MSEPSERDRESAEWLRDRAGGRDPGGEMICPVCGGTGDHPATRDEHGQPPPCSECGGCGIAHCCEGDCAQPEPEEKADDVT